MTNVYNVACSIYVGNHASAVEQCRKLINTHQFNNEPLRILVSTLSSGLRATDSFISSTLQKHLFREVRLSDAAIRTPELLKWSSASRRYHLSSTKGAGEVDVGTKGLDILDEDGEDAGDYAEPSDDKKPVRLPTKNNPMPVMVHGQLCLTAKSYQSALCEFFFFFWCILLSNLHLHDQFIFCMHTTIAPRIL